MPVDGPVWAVVVAAGSGARFGRPKQFEPLGGRPVLAWAVAAARSVADGVVVVLPPERVADVTGGLDAEALEVDAVVAGGPTRSASVRCGLAAVPEAAVVVVVHDAARPLAAAELFRAVVAGLAPGTGGAVDGAICAGPGAATPKRLAGDGTAAGTPPRHGPVAGQAPQAFRVDPPRPAPPWAPRAPRLARGRRVERDQAPRAAVEPQVLLAARPGDQPGDVARGELRVRPPHQRPADAVASEPLGNGELVLLRDPLNGTADVA